MLELELPYPCNGHVQRWAPFRASVVLHSLLLLSIMTVCSAYNHGLALICGPYRGCRAGSHRRIPNIITDRCTQLLIRGQSGVNVNNLAAVPSRQFKPSLILLNTDLFQNKATIVSEYVADKAVDLVAVTETWLPIDSQYVVINDLCPRGYNFLSAPRGTGKCGGVGLLYLTCYSVQLRRLKTQVTTFERLTVTIKGRRLLQLIVVYRPPPSRVNGHKTSTFMREFLDFAAELLLLPGGLLVVGNFNLHVDDVADSSARQFLDVRDTLDLQQGWEGVLGPQGVGKMNSNGLPAPDYVRWEIASPLPTPSSDWPTDIKPRWCIRGPNSGIS